MKVGVVILNWKGWRDTLVCLESLQHSKNVSLDVVIIDNGSKDESVDQISSWLIENGQKVPSVQMRLQPEDQNYGFSEGCNRGLQTLLKSDCAYFLLLNNDTVIEADCIEELVQASQKAQADLVGAHVLSEDRKHSLYQGRSWPGHLFGRGDLTPNPNDAIWPTDQVDGSCFLFTRKFLEHRLKASGYALDPELYLYCEDSDLAIFGKMNGYKSVVAARARVYHGLSKSSGGAGNPRTFYYISRNRIYLANRWLNPLMKALFHVYYLSSRLVLIGLYWSKGRRAVCRAIIAGIRDGYAGVRGPMIEGRL